MLMRVYLVAACCLLTGATAIAQSGVDFRGAFKATSPATVAVMLDADNDLAEIHYQLRKNGAVPDAPFFGWMRSTTLSMDKAKPMRMGFAVAPDLVISCGVPDGSQEVDLVAHDGRKLKGRVVVRDQVTGLSAIRIDNASLSVLAVAADPPQPGLPVIVSWLQGGKTVTSEAAMIATDLISDESEIGYAQYLNADSTPQKSGAPIVDASAAVVGVLISQSGQSICLPATHVTRLVAAASEEEPSDLLRGRLGIRLVDHPKEEGVAMIASVMEDMPAEKAELKAGDRVLKVGERPCKSHLDVMAAVAMSRAGDEVTLEIGRGEETLERTIKLSSAGPESRRTRFTPVVPGAPQQLFQLKDGKLVPMGKDLETGEFRLTQPPAFVYGSLQAERSKLEESLKKLEAENARLKEIVETIKENLKSDPEEE